MKKRIFVFLLVTIMLISMIPVAAAADAPEAVKWDLSKSKEATNLDENFESRVTLSLPAGDYKGDLDVVFVLDGSTSTDAANLAASAAGLLDELAQFENLNVKAGVVIFGGSVPLLYNGELVALTADSLVTLKNVLADKSYDGASGRSGSNLQAGVIAGQKLLNADSAVADSDKYLILLTDGGARMWVNENGEALSQGFRLNDAKGVSWGDNQDFASRYIDAGESAMPLRTFDEVWNAGSTDASFAKYAMTQAEAKQTDAWKRAANWGTVRADKDGAYYTSLEVSTYYAATSIIDAGKHAHVIWVDYPYHSGMYVEYTNSFKSWLDENGYITRYDSSVIDPKTIFANVKDQLIYLLDAGSYVVDYMGYVADDYNLDFISKAETLNLTVGGAEKAVVPLGTNHYGFGSQLTNDKYEFELTYYPGDAEDEHFKLDINVPVTKDKPVKLSYTVKLVNPKSVPGTYGEYDQYGANNDGSSSYGLYTNNSATLTPVDSNGKKGAPEDFKKPTVSYTVEDDYLLRFLWLNTQEHYSYLIGYSDGTVRPEGKITRAEVATIFFRLLTDDARAKFWMSTNDYSDVTADKWYNNAVSTLSRMGVISGYSDGTFRPNAPISRAEFAKIAVSFSNVADLSYFGYFSDVDASDWFSGFVTAAKKAGLIEGYSDGTFKPEKSITRAEVCTIVNRALGRKSSARHMKISDRIDWPDAQVTDWYYEAIMEATNSHTYQMGKLVETWNDKLPQRDWALLETGWANAYTGKGGEVR